MCTCHYEVLKGLCLTASVGVCMCALSGACRGVFENLRDGEDRRIKQVSEEIKPVLALSRTDLIRHIVLMRGGAEGPEAQT